MHSDLKRLKQIQSKLLYITKGCRQDMHEPDCQGVSAKVVGTELDNAFGDHIDLKNLLGGFQEIVVVIKNDDINAEERFNLADLIALARLNKNLLKNV